MVIVIPYPYPRPTTGPTEGLRPTFRRRKEFMVPLRGKQNFPLAAVYAGIAASRVACA